MAIGPYATNMGKWGIPGKSNKNVAEIFFCSLSTPIGTSDSTAEAKFKKVFFGTP